MQTWQAYGLRKPKKELVRLLMKEQQRYVIYFVIRNCGGSVFVKDGQFFMSQGGLAQKWGKGWRAIRAVSLEDARAWAEANLP